MKIRLLLLGSWLTVAPALALAADPKQEECDSMEVRVGSAKSPEEHRTLAACFSGKAKAARRDANIHHQMELSYSHFFPAREMVKHCQELIALDKQMARAYEELARFHTDAAEREGGSPGDP